MDGGTDRTERDELVIEFLGGQCPMQAWGTVGGREFYFRSRWDSWTFSVAPPGLDPVGRETCGHGGWFRQETWGDGPYDAGYMSADEAERIVRACAADCLRDARASDPTSHVVIETTRAPDLVLRDLGKLHWQGTVRAGTAETTDLPTVAKAFGLSDDPASYWVIDAIDAFHLLVLMLHRDVGVGTEVMPLPHAQRLAAELTSLVPDARFFTRRWNGALGDFATFATGVIALGSASSLCVWFEERPMAQGNRAL